MYRCSSYRVLRDTLLLGTSLESGELVSRETKRRAPNELTAVVIVEVKIVHLSLSGSTRLLRGDTRAEPLSFGRAACTLETRRGNRRQWLVATSATVFVPGDRSKLGNAYAHVGHCFAMFAPMNQTSAFTIDALSWALRLKRHATKSTSSTIAVVLDEAVHWTD